MFLLVWQGKGWWLYIGSPETLHRKREQLIENKKLGVTAPSYVIDNRTYEQLAEILADSPVLGVTHIKTRKIQ